MKFLIVFQEPRSFLGQRGEWEGLKGVAKPAGNVRFFAQGQDGNGVEVNGFEFRDLPSGEDTGLEIGDH